MRMFGLPGDRTPDLDEHLDAIHPGDRGAVREALSKAIVLEERGSVEYRVPVVEGETLRYLAFGGGRHTGPDGGRVLTGMTLDITERRRAEEAMVAQRGQLAHLSRVVAIGEISDALAREIGIESAQQVKECGRVLYRYSLVCVHSEHLRDGIRRKAAVCRFPVALAPNEFQVAIPFRVMGHAPKLARNDVLRHFHGPVCKYADGIR